MTYGKMMAMGMSVLALTAVAEKAQQDYEPGVYHNARERAANTLKYSIAPNRLAEKVAAGELARGGYMELGDPVVAEAMGLAGLDFVWIDAEHHPYTVRDLMLIDIALKGTGCASLVRVRSHDPDYLKQILDTGIDGIIVPMVNSEAEAKAVIAACRYPQAGGKRGICVTRQNGYGKQPLKDYLKRSETAPFICLEIEDKAALPEVDKILAVEGYDAILVGPSDLSCSMGGLYKARTPEVRKLIGDIGRKAREHGKLFYALDASWIKEFGFADMVDGATDLGAISSSAREFMRTPLSVNR